MKIVKFFLPELRKLGNGFAFLLLNLILLALWRNFDVKTFLFLQIVATHIITIAICYFVSVVKEPKWKGEELLMFFLSLFLISLILLNIDRSRSVFLLKWANEAGPAGIEYSVLAEQSGLKSNNTKDYLQRIDEGVQSKNLKVQNKKVEITSQGKFLLIIFRLIADIEKLNGFKGA